VTNTFPNSLAAPVWHWSSFAFAIAAIFWATSVARPRSFFARALWAIIAACVGIGFFGGVVTTTGYLIGGAVALAIGLAATFDRRFDAKRWFARAVDPIVLRRPFRETWKVAAGGADPAHNHHQSVSDQVFAYDFLCEDGPSWDREILAPCDGTIAWTVDTMEDAPPDEARRDAKNPAGNYVSIETPRGYVILAHLRKGSIAILPGNTRGAHLHVHAQNRAQMAVDVAEGLPIAFLDGAGQAMILEYGDLLGPSTKL
jgi:hypothetical protein